MPRTTANPSGEGHKTVANGAKYGIGENKNAIYWLGLIYFVPLQCMKIFTGTQIKELDKYTMEHEPISSIDLMERAARAITDAITREWRQDTRVVVFAGPGNNGGDALAVARMLASRGYSVDTYLFNVSGHLSDDCAANKKRLEKDPKKFRLKEITVDFDPPALEKGMLVVDGLFGSGLKKPLAGGFAALVKYINQSEATVVSIDMPSGLMTEDNTYNVRQNIIRADLTLTLQQKKLSMMFAENQKNIGQLAILNISLSQEYIDQTHAQYTTSEREELAERMLPRDEFAHKGSMGHALLVAGSHGMAGAAILAARACMRSGAGKTTVLTPQANCLALQLGVPEAIVRLDKDNERFTTPVETEPYDAMAIGPGLGTEEDTAIAMIAQMRRAQCPMVADADALNMLGSHRAWMQQLPEGMILTPHPRELERLCGNTMAGDYERLSAARDLAERLEAYVILKGHYSALCTPDGDVTFNTTGNAGMATAGSGDVLTGLITGLLARGYDQRQACLLGMHLHGLAGDLAARELGEESLVAGDIVKCLPKAFKEITRDKFSFDK